MERRVGDEQLLTDVGGSRVRIARLFAFGEHVVPDRMAVLHSEPAAPVITHAAELRRASLRLDLAARRSNAHVAAADVDLDTGSQ